MAFQAAIGNKHYAYIWNIHSSINNIFSHKIF